MRRRRLLAAIAGSGGAILGGCQYLDLSGTREDGAGAADEREVRDTPAGRTPTEGERARDTPVGGEPTETPTADEPTETPRFDRVVDMVADRNVDPNGNRPIDETLADAAEDGTLLEFPPGEYLVTEPLVLESATALGIRGIGQHRNDVRFVHPTGYSEFLLNVRGGADCLLENFTADQTDDDVTNSGITIIQRDGLEIRDVEVAGFTPTDGPGPDEEGSLDLSPVVTDPDGVGTVTRFVTKGGGEVGVYPRAYQGIYAGPQNAGTLRLVDCHVEDCGSNGVYASRTPGPVQILGGLYKNSGVSQIRVSGEGSLIRNARIVVDTDASRASRGSYGTVRGVWWESGPRGKTGGTVEASVFYAGSAPIRRGLIEVDGTAGAMTVRACQFRIDRDDYFAIDAFAPGSTSMGGAPDRPWDLTLRDVHVTGSAGGRVAVRIRGRPDSRFEGLRIDQGSPYRDGLALQGSPGCRLQHSRIDVGHYPIVVSSGTGSSTRDCQLQLDGDSLLVSDLYLAAVRQSPVGSQLASGATCIPRFDPGDGPLAIVESCGDRYAGWYLDGDSDRTPAGTPSGSPSGCG